MIDTTVNDGSSNVEGKSLAGGSGQLLATHARPRPRAVKEKIYREQVKQRQITTPQGLASWAVEIVKTLRSRDAEARKQANRDIATFYQYYDCNEYGEFNEAGEWVPDLNAGDDDFAYSVPLVPAHVDAAKTLLLKTALEYEYDPTNKISVLDKQVAKMCEELAEEDMERIFTSTDLPVREKLYILLAGKSWRHHYWARNPLDPVSVHIPIYQNEETDGKAWRVCANPDCGTPLKDDDEICPKCMSDKIETIDGGKITKATQSNRKVTLGENQMYVPNPLAVQHDLSKTNINASFVVERDALPRSEAEFLYSQVLPTTRNQISEETKMVRELERSRLRTGNLRGEELISALNLMGLTNDEHDLCERERVWLTPWQYANVLITEEHWYYTKADGLFWCEDDKDLPENATKVEKNTFLGDIYPNGLFLCNIDDNSIEINGAAVADNWIKLIFGMRPANSDGAGMRRLRHLADMANDATNLEFKVLMDDADPKTFLDRSYLSHLAKVGEYNIVDSLKDNHTWENVVHRLEGAASHPALGAVSERVQALAQFMVGTFSSVGAGAPDIRASGTATGVVKMAEEAAGRYLEAILEIKIADIESRYKVLKNRQRNSIDPQKQDLEKRFGAEVVQRFMTGNLRQIVSITVKKGTDQPQSQAINIATLEAYSNAASQIGQLPDGQGMLAQMGELINIPVTVGIGMSDREEANRRIGLMQEWAEPLSDKPLQPDEMIQEAINLVSRVLAESEKEVPVDQVEMQQPLAGDGQPPQAMPAPPMQLPPGPQGQEMPPMPGGPPPDEAPPAPVPSVIMMQEHPVFMDACKDWLMTEGARSRNNALKAAISLMWKLHYAREIVKQKEMLRIEGDKQMVVEKMKAQAAGELAPPPPPMNKISESINYKDAPDDVRRQMEAAAGMQPSQMSTPPPTTPADDAAAEEKANAHEITKSVLDRVAEEHAKDADHVRQEDAKEGDLQRETLKAEHAAELTKETQAAAPRGNNQ